jgi:hypothetical protein
MKIATVLNVHADPILSIDTIGSIFCHMTKNVLVVVDGGAWEQFKDIDLPVAKICGFRHKCSKSPYRNVALGLYSLIEQHPNMDWYCYCEQDVLFGSSRFKENLRMADERDVWMLGNDGHVDDKSMPLVESLVGEKLPNIYYLIGCCQFFSKKFINKLNEINFFERFLHLTNEFSSGYFPEYDGYDISEHMYPTLCRHFGGNIGVFATFDYDKQEWHGAHQYYPVRWKPDLEGKYPEASILHPLKTYDHPIREYYRGKRNKWRNTAQPMEELSE